MDTVGTHISCDMLNYISADIGGTFGTAVSVHLFCLVWVPAVLVFGTEL